MPKALKRYLSKNGAVYIFTTPAMIIIFLFILYPILQTCIMSFTYWYLVMPKKGHPFVGISNFKDFFSSSQFFNMIIVTFLYTIVSVAGKMLIGLGTALLLNKRFVGRVIVRAIIIIPWAMPTLVVCIIFRLSLDQAYGMINAILRNIGIIHKAIPFLDDPILALISVIVIAIWRYFPFVTLMILAALQGIPEELYEAASLDGAGALRKFAHISWPWLRPVWTIVLLLQLVWTVKEFELVYLITRGGPGYSTALIGIDVYLNAFRFTKVGTASAEGMILVVFSLIFGIMYYRLIGGKKSI